MNKKVTWRKLCEIYERSIIKKLIFIRKERERERLHKNKVFHTSFDFSVIPREARKFGQNYSKIFYVKISRISLLSLTLSSSFRVTDKYTQFIHTYGAL